MKSKSTPKAHKSKSAASDPKPKADILKAKLYELSTGKDAVAFHEGMPSEDDHPLVDIRPRGLGAQYGPLAWQVTDLIAQAAEDGVFAAPLFAELRSRIFPHLNNEMRLPIVAGAVAWLRGRGYKIAGGWAQEIRQVADGLAASAAKGDESKQVLWNEKAKGFVSATEISRLYNGREIGTGHEIHLTWNDIPKFAIGRVTHMRMGRRIKVLLVEWRREFSKHQTEYRVPCKTPTKQFMAGVRQQLKQPQTRESKS